MFTPSSKKKFIFTLSFVLLLSVPLFCLTIEREGVGETIEGARSEAAAEISRFLYSNVDATTVATLFDSGEGIESSILIEAGLRSQLPLLGVTYTDRVVGDLCYSTATMDSRTSLPLYYEYLDLMMDSLSMPSLEGVGTIEAASILNGILDSFEEYKKLAYVVKALGGVYGKEPSVSEGEIRSILSKVNGTIDSLDKAAFVLVKGCDFSGIYVESPMPVSDSVASDFSAVFANAISGNLSGKTVVSMQNAMYFLSSRYAESQNGDLFIVASLNDLNGRNVFSSSVTVPHKLIEGMSLYANGYDFRKALLTGESVSNDFNIYIRINGGNTGSTFKLGDELYVEVKASQVCYYYIVGYVFDDEGNRFSYLFPVSVNSDGKGMFIGRIDSSKVGKWVIINPSYMGHVIPLEIMPPLGVETLQVYASTTTDFNEIMSMIPKWEETDDFYIVAGEPEQVLSTTRALSIKKTAVMNNSVQNSESNVTYRSIKK